MSTILNPLTYIADPTRGRPVFNGQVYFGTPDTDPVQPENRLQLRIVNENGTLTDIGQPVRTGPGGIALHQGNPVALDLAETEYSMTIQDANGVQVAYVARGNIFGELGDTVGNINQFRTFGTPRYITAAENNNTPFPYGLYARVVYDDGTGDNLYESIIDNNNSLPSNSNNWRRIDTEAVQAEFLQVTNNLSDLNDVTTARNNLSLGSAATANTGLAASQVPTTGQADNRYVRQEGTATLISVVDYGNGSNGFTMTLSQSYQNFPLIFINFNNGSSVWLPVYLIDLVADGGIDQIGIGAIQAFDTNSSNNVVWLSAATTTQFTISGFRGNNSAGSCTVYGIS